MAMLAKVLGVYLVFAVASVYCVWRLIAWRGFAGLVQTDSPLAKLFPRKFPEDSKGPRPAAMAR